ncbi:DNA helicase [Gordonia phage Lambo]|uniref:DNA helicase n=1 Tax=Gordonia phage Lambo TaxID=2599845 RepID=A0A5J6TUL5_9CAUD|nr:DNA helicase [Gordonia phage Lambo]QFG13567.1 DNA helicase [Gordonia phage Lambo]
MKRVVRTEIVDGKIGLVTEGMHWETGRDLAKMIPGGRWNKAKKTWTYPLDYRICLEIRKAANKYEAKVAIGPELNAWALAEKARLADRPEVGSMELVDLPKIREQYPNIWKAISSRPFQTVSVKFISHSRSAVLADDPGLGKTLQSIATVANNYDEGIFLVVAPKSAATITWPKEIHRWLPGDAVINMYSLSAMSPKDRPAYFEKVNRGIEQAPGRIWVVTSPYWIQVKAEKDRQGEFKRDAKGNVIKHYKLPLLFEWEWDGVIVDESHKAVIANTAKRSKHTQTRFGLDELFVADNALKLALSGTPMRGKAENMWGTLNWLKPKYYTSYWKWMDKHFEVYESEDGYGSGKVYEGLRDKAAFYEDMKDLFIRRTKAEVASDLPPKMYGGEPLNPDDPDSPHGVWLDLLPKQKKQYEQMVKEGATDEGIIANGILSEWTRLKQFAGAVCEVRADGSVAATTESNKIEWIEEFLDDRGILDDSGENKVIIASQFSKMVDAIGERLDKLKVPYFKLTGGTKTNERVTMADRFQEPGGPKVFLLTTTAGGVSLTLDAADDVVICDETWVPDDQLQVEDRAHRLSRTDHNVTIWYLRSRGTIEEAIAAVTTGRMDETLGVMDESRGVEIKRIALKHEEITK